MGLLQDQVVLITGAARGQGRAHALASTREGADVIALDMVRDVESLTYPLSTEADLMETIGLVEKCGRRALPIHADVRRQNELDDAVSRGLDEFGRVDAVIANAGIWSTRPFWELDEPAWNDVIDTNLTGVWKTAKAAAPHLIERRRGSIVVIASVNGVEPGANFAHYTAAKHGVIGLMRTIAVELGPFGIRCNAICPGIIDTDMNRNPDNLDVVAGHPGGTVEEWFRGGYHYGILRGRSHLPADVIADTALYLNSALAEHVTGVAIPVDAGHLLLRGHNFDPVVDAPS